MVGQLVFHMLMSHSGLLDFLLGFSYGMLPCLSLFGCLCWFCGRVGFVDFCGD